MQFGIIYTVEVANGTRLKPFVPKGNKWRCTERDDTTSELGHYDESDVPEGVTDAEKFGFWCFGRHRKYCACLTKKQFEAFIAHTGMTMSTVETGGSIGAPTPDGICIGNMPAVCFELRHDPHEGKGYRYDLNAYVTPYPEVKRGEKRGFVDRDFERTRKAMLNIWG